jgi:peptide-methionine (S)-S-oxide reductase
MPVRFPAAWLILAIVAVLAGAGQAPQDEKTSDSPKSSSEGKASKAKSAPDDAKTSEGTKSSESDSSAAKEKDKKPSGPKMEVATLGGGCFWCMEAVFERLKGVKSVVSGYAGGNVPYPSYDLVCTGTTGHAEVIQVEYDANVLPFEKLLKIFFVAHDPTTLNAQEPDFGPQYRSIILYHNEEQRDTARKVYKELTARKAYRNPIVTELVPFQAFYPAEPYHQDYYRHHPDVDYSVIIIGPKLRKVRTKLQHLK